MLEVKRKFLVNEMPNLSNYFFDEIEKDILVSFLKLELEEKMKNIMI